MPAIDEPGLPHTEPEENSRHGRLTVRVGPPVTSAHRTGILSFDAPGGELLALAYVPPSAHGRPYDLAVLLHGAGGSARQGLDLMLPLADTRRLMLIAPQSAAASWDLISTGFGPDVLRIDRILGEVLDTYPVKRMVIGGFSDGASYALSIGLVNGDLFDAVVAFSPGFAAPLVTHGTPRVFVCHGTQDPVLPVDRCSRRLVPQLRALDYQVTYEEFDGGHEVPNRMIHRALDWLFPA